MYWRTQRFVWAQGVTNGFLAALTTIPAAALMTTPTLVLFTAGPTIEPSSTEPEFTEAAFSGYAAVVLTPSAPVVTGGTDKARLESALFIAGAGLVDPGETCLGYLVTDGNAAFYGGEMFDEPFTFGAPGDFLEIDLILPLPGIFAPSVS